MGPTMIVAYEMGVCQPPVPGPLPVLGVASALAWSRRLRLRLNAGRQVRP
jgi:hypothetical protein